MTREHKLALIVGFALILVVGVFVSDHFSKARLAKPGDQLATSAGMPFGQQRPPVAFPNPVVEPVAAAPAPAPRHEPAEWVHGVRPRLDSPLAGDVGSASRGVPGFSGAGFNAGRDLPAAAYVVNVPGEGSVPLGRDLRSEELSSGAQARPAALPVSSGEMRRHTVVRGDALAKIATRYYADEKLWRRLAEYNATRVGADASVKTGVTLLIPPRDVLMGQATLAPEGARRAAPERDQAGTPARADLAKADPKKPVASPPKPATRSYTVKSGDTLALIAQRELGSSRRWREIHKLNAHALGDEDTIGVGMVLMLPVDGKS